MSRNRRAAAATLLVFALTVAACSKKPDDHAPTKAAGSPTSVTGSTGVTIRGSGGPPPSGPPGVTGTIDTGEAQVQVIGDITATLDLRLASPAVFAPPPGGMALTWNDGKKDLLAIGGASFTGERKTSHGLVASIALKMGPGFSNFTSSAGECTITITTAEAGNLSGSFDCKRLKSAGDETIDAKGTFLASG